MTKFEDLLADHVASSLAKQEALGSLLGNHEWDLDLNAGTVDFGRGLLYPVQILGTDSELAGTWLWSWANTVSNVPRRLMEAANELRSLECREAIAELPEPRLPLERVNGHTIALIASGVCQADCYYR